VKGHLQESLKYLMLLHHYCGKMDFRHNEFDKVDQDIHDVANQTIAAELSKGVVTIRTVEEYCNYMVRCYEAKPDDVKKILRLL